MSKQTNRKPHHDFIGYRAELRNPHSGGHTIILDCKLAVQQGHPLVVDWDEEGGRYQVLCNSHSNIIHCTSMPRARSAMKDPLSFCVDCRVVERLSRGILPCK
jgi:beta-glucosidase-like glycosyl hydrolase